MNTQDIERRLFVLFSELPLHLRGQISVQFMRDDDFVHRRDRTENDIHVFFEIPGGSYFHLRGYTRHMLLNPDKVEQGLVFLTGYHKNRIELNGGQHAIRQDWYVASSQKLAAEIASQISTFTSR